MKLFFILLAYFIPTIAMAQSVWEKPTTDYDNKDDKTVEGKVEKPSKDAKYLAGAVPEVDGKVEWQLDVDVPGKTADQIYSIMLNCLTDLTKTDIARRGKQLGIDYAETWSCYKGGERHCGKCGTCVERREALRDAGIDDTTEYEER